MFVFYEGILSLYLIEEVEKEVDFTHSTPNCMELDLVESNWETTSCGSCVHEFAWSHHACVDSTWVLQLLHTLQRHAC